MTSEILLGNNHYATVGIANSDRYAANGYAWRMSTGVASVVGTSNSYVAFHILKPSTLYTLKITALGTNTKLAASLGIAYIPVQM